MSKILAIDTATDHLSIALQLEHEIFVEQICEARKHQQCLLPLIKKILTEQETALAELSVIALSQGPGSFTGLRIGFAVAQALAFAHAIPVSLTSTLAIMAQQVWEQEQQEQVCVALDARMQEVYFACYQVDQTTGLMQLQGQEVVSAPEQTNLPEGQWYAVGSAWQAYPQLSQKHNEQLLKLDPNLMPHAQYLLKFAARQLEVGQVVAAEEAQPSYIRNKVTS